jgi:hypothetical protein
MKHFYWVFLFLPVFLVIVAEDLCGQSWNFIKEKDGIKIFTSTVLNSSLKSFKGETTFRAKMDKVGLLLGNTKNLDWWDKDISEIKVLASEENKSIQLYLVYDLPWPLTNRDLVILSQISTDPLTGEKTVFSTPLSNVVPEKPNLVRIRKFWQKWTIQSLEKGYVHVILEGFIEPGGNIPPWLYNLRITETPLKVIRSLRERVLSERPANQ